MSFTCIIVDDEIHARKVVEKYVQDLPHITLIKSCKNALEAMEVLRTQNIDVMFLDINMPKLSGLNFLESITSPPLVVITTAYREYALEAFELDVIDYLHKPIPFPRFLKAISKVEDKLKVNHLENSSLVVQSNDTSQDFIFIKADKKTLRLNFKDIRFIEGLGDYIKIHTYERIIVSKLSIKKMETLLPKDHFPRVHKSFIVSLQFVDAIEGNQIEVGSDKIPIGQIYRQSFMEIVNSYLKK